MNDNPRDRYRRFGQNKSVRLPAEEYVGVGNRFSVTVCCKDRVPYLENKVAARAVLDAFTKTCQIREYRPWVVCVMPDHVHFVVESECHDVSLTTIVGEAKSKALNRVLDKVPLYWQPRFRDTKVWDDDGFKQVVEYALANPVAAEFVTRWEDWPWLHVDAVIREGWH